MSRIYIALTILALVLGTGYALFKRDQSLQDRIVTLTVSNESLKAGLETSEEATKSLLADIEAMNKTLKDVNEGFANAREVVENLEKTFSEHDFGALAVSETTLIQSIIRKAADDTGRCFEIASGKPRTEKEINATKPSEVNGTCPSLANPNWVQ